MRSFCNVVVKHFKPHTAEKNIIVNYSTFGIPSFWRLFSTSTLSTRAPTHIMNIKYYYLYIRFFNNFHVKTSNIVSIQRRLNLSISILIIHYQILSYVSILSRLEREWISKSQVAVLQIMFSSVFRREKSMISLYVMINK